MRELFADLFISLDGFASGINEAAYFGYFGPDLGRWIQKQLSEPQMILMGRVTYEALAGFSAKATDEVSTRMSALPKAVCSGTLQEPLVWKNTRVIKGDAAEEIKALKRQGGDPLRTIGSIRLVKSLMEQGLVDHLRLMVFPLILGQQGKEPFFAEYSRTPLELVKNETLDERLILLEYHGAAVASRDAHEAPMIGEVKYRVWR
ncbi:MAG TPA: dihydrofolate reductase family protein [Candidatus Acidoferrales bacterium]|nr:dihydrofolate reductase family protein [Candidatus Acidoferrales bacterium]